MSICSTKAGTHALSDAETTEAIDREAVIWRLQLAGSRVQVIELVPPAVQTDLLPGPNAANPIPLDAHLDDTPALLESQPDAEEILVERMKPLRSRRRTGGAPPLSGRRAGRDPDTWQAATRERSVARR